MSRCITLASILTFAACTHSPPPPSEHDWAAPPPKPQPPTAVSEPPAVAAQPASNEPATSDASAPTQPAILVEHPCRTTRSGTCWDAFGATPVAEPDCRMTRSGTCWGQPKKPRVVKTAPGAKP